MILLKSKASNIVKRNLLSNTCNQRLNMLTSCIDDKIFDKLNQSDMLMIKFNNFIYTIVAKNL